MVFGHGEFLKELADVLLAYPGEAAVGSLH